MELFFIFTFCIAATTASNYHWFTMSADKVTLVKSTWNEVKENEVEILYGVFKDYPNIQARFPKFTGKDLKMIKNTVDFTIQATRTASFLNTYINLLGKDSTQPAIKQMLNTMGENHKKRGITKENFEFFKIHS
uniref:Globin n=1 Tax=Polypedilum vanderplanki TaxID=319348 RepID=S6CDF9_POLVA|nr:globin [Polypedilum vanderplanki]